jgi:tetrahydromethanopterin S-methyltransferase subunit B
MLCCDFYLTEGMMSEKEETERFEKDHNCAQGATLAVICEKLERIERSIAKIETNQDEYMKRINDISVADAKYPSPEDVSTMIRTLERHNTYFTIFGAALVSAWGLILLIASKLWGS